MNYKRDDQLNQWLTKNWITLNDNCLYCPKNNQLQALADANPQWFTYQSPCLLSPDRKILYGYSVEDLEDSEELSIDNSVEIYDNLCSHIEDPSIPYHVWIGDSLQVIADKEDCFGMHVEAFYVSDKNLYFSEQDGILYDHSGETLILFPSGRTTEHDEIGMEMDCFYVQLPTTTKCITALSFCMNLLPHTLVIPDSVEVIEKNAFFEHYDKGYWMTDVEVKQRSIIAPGRFETVFAEKWSKDSHNRPNIMFY